MKNTRFVFVVVVALGIALSGCSGKTPADQKGQVAVEVNGQPIMAAAFGVRARPDLSGSLLAPVSASDMKTMIDLELLRQAAVQDKLDQDETIHAELAKAPNGVRKILAFAFINKQLSSVPSPTDADISAYYNSNPLQFAQRKHYVLQTCAVKSVVGREAEIKAELARSKKFGDFEQWLKTNKMKYGCVPVSWDSARVDEKLLRKLANVPIGGGVSHEGKDWMSITFVTTIKNDAVTLDQAKAQITKTLLSNRKAAAYVQMIKQLRDKATIEYVPPYTANGMTAKAIVMPGEKDVPGEKVMPGKKEQ
jgi:EpsD family peptidyl-prolyl cis-trans isomerase